MFIKEVKMAKIRDVLVHVVVETAAKKRKCHHTKKHSISKGEACLVVKGGEFNSGKNYCKECAEKMLALVDDRLEDIRADLS